MILTTPKGLCFIIQKQASIDILKNKCFQNFALSSVCIVTKDKLRQGCFTGNFPNFLEHYSVGRKPLLVEFKMVM